MLRRCTLHVREGGLRAQRRHRNRRATVQQIVHPEAGAHHKRHHTHVQAHRHTSANWDDLVAALRRRATREDRRTHHAHVSGKARLVHRITSLAHLLRIQSREAGDVAVEHGVGHVCQHEVGHRNRVQHRTETIVTGCHGHTRERLVVPSRRWHQRRHDMYHGSQRRLHQTHASRQGLRRQRHGCDKPGGRWPACMPAEIEQSLAHIKAKDGTDNAARKRGHAAHGCNRSRHDA